MDIEIEEGPLEGLKLIKPKVFRDSRGYFTESFNQKKWLEQGLPVHFVQDNQSMSRKGTLRGLHFQRPPHAQGKLVRVVRGSVLDVALDLRKSSPTYGKTYQVVLSADNFLQLYIPEGFAHGFLTLEDDTIFHYKCTGYYDPQSEGGIAWNDPGLEIDWGTDDPFLSEKDRNYTYLQNFNSPF